MIDAPDFVGIAGLSIDAATMRAVESAYAVMFERFVGEAAAAVASVRLRNEASLRTPGFVGLGIGEALERGRPTGRPGLRVLLRRSAERPDSANEIPKDVNGVPVNVETVGEIVPLSFRGRHRPVVGGCSLGNARDPQGNTGTLGCHVTDTVEGRRRRLILSNNHVIALNNKGNVGDPIIQPGVLDGGSSPKDHIADLLRWIPISFTGAPNTVDAAVAELLPDIGRKKAVLSGGGGTYKLRGPRLAPALGLGVEKSGRTTGETTGMIDLINLSINVSYPSSGVAVFVNQFRVVNPSTPFSAPGDSGSLVVTHDHKRPVGLLFAGELDENGAHATYCNPIDDVLKQLGVNIAY